MMEKKEQGFEEATSPPPRVPLFERVATSPFFGSVPSQFQDMKLEDTLAFETPRSLEQAPSDTDSQVVKAVTPPTLPTQGEVEARLLESMKFQPSAVVNNSSPFRPVVSPILQQGHAKAQLYRNLSTIRASGGCSPRRFEPEQLSPWRSKNLGSPFRDQGGNQFEDVAAFLLSASKGGNRFREAAEFMMNPVNNGTRYREAAKFLLRIEEPQLRLAEAARFLLSAGESGTRAPPPSISSPVFNTEDTGSRWGERPWSSRNLYRETRNPYGAFDTCLPGMDLEHSPCEIPRDVPMNADPMSPLQFSTPLSAEPRLMEKSLLDPMYSWSGSANRYTSIGSFKSQHSRNYAEIAAKGELFHFGGEGSEEGKLCRPWGICCDLRSRIIVADRSNNRIQVFDEDGKFILKFGTMGVRAGQFDRPAGVAVNSHNHIVVADKDNHRIQVFDESGNFILKFGERGRQVGTFNYPWGVAVNGANQIAVTDTRNHRVQIFSASGLFLRKCGFDSTYYYKHLDSPRGLCFLPDGQLVITDFNNHRFVVVSQRSSEIKIYGTEGQAEGQFCRPQGVATDADGHFLICDSRNNRIQVFDPRDMRCIASWSGVTPTPMASSGDENMPSVKNFKGFEIGNGLESYLHATLSPSAPQLFSPSQAYGTVVSSPSTSSQTFGEGPSTSSLEQPGLLLDRPTDLCVSPDGRVYVIDFGNNCVRVF